MKQGEIWLVNLDPTIGAEIRKTRPCVIVSDDVVGVLPLKIIAPLTDLKTRYCTVPWMVVIKPDNVNNLTKPSALDLFQVRCVAEQRLVKKIGEVSPQICAAAQKALKVAFGIP